MKTVDASASFGDISYRILGVRVKSRECTLIPAASNFSGLDFMAEKFLPASMLH
jgi:hypothetical protein